MRFAHLHTHTEYSLLDGSNKTDHGVMYGVVDFYEECRRQGIRPILGCEVYVAPSSRFDRETGGGEDRYHHLILLAENNTGYRNLVKIVSCGFEEGFYYRPRVDKDVLRQYHEGLICTSACLAGEVARLLTRGFYEEAREAALTFREIFGEEKKKKKKIRRYDGGEQIRKFSELQVGDYVVHEHYGIGIYRGVEKIEVDHIARD